MLRDYSANEVYMKSEHSYESIILGLNIDRGNSNQTR